MTPPDTWRERLAWASAGGLAATIYQISHDYASGKLTRRMLALRLGALPLILGLSASIAEQMTLSRWVTGIVTTILFLIGRDGLDYFARATAAKWLGVPMPGPTTVFAEPDSHVPVPHAAPDVEVIAVGKATPKNAAEAMIKIYRETPLEPGDAQERRLLRRLDEPEEQGE